MLMTSALPACPFCEAEQSTLTEELAACDAAVIARLVRAAPAFENAPTGPIDPDSGKAGFKISETLFGEERLAGATEVDALYFGEPDKQAYYLVRGFGEPLEWGIPTKLSELAAEYVKQLRNLPAEGVDRIAFFQDYLQHDDTMLAQDAYDEFARAPYSWLKDLKDRMNREQLLAWISDPATSPSRRRLFLTMLGVCGQAEDIPRLEQMLLSDSRLLVPAAECLASVSLATGGPLAVAVLPESTRLDERRKKLGLDAMIACYLTLKGEEGMDLVDQRFLSTEEVMGKLPDYSHIYSALMALRFLAEESDLVTQDRVLESARLLLDNPDFADQVIPDLARWEDWSVLERLAKMYAVAGEEGSGVQKYVREPIITYLDVATEAEGKAGEQAIKALESIESIDPDAVRRARSLRAFGFLAQARKTPAPATDTPPDPTGLGAIGDEAVVLAEDVPSTDIPDPSVFAAEEDTKSVEEDSPPQPAPEEPALPTPTKPTQEQKPSPPAEKPVVAEAAPAEPPGWALLIGIPTLAAAACFGLFWVILRSGTA